VRAAQPTTRRPGGRRPLGEEGGGAWFLAHYLRPLVPAVVALGLLLSATTALQLAGPQVVRTFVDAAAAGALPGELQRLAALFMALAAAQQGLTVVATYGAERIGWSATNRLREDLAVHCLQLDLPFYHAHTPGELIERLDGDVTALANFASQFVVQVGGNALLLLGIAASLWRVDWRAGLELTGFATVALLAMTAMRGAAIPYWRVARQASAELFGYLEERLAGTEDVRANGATGYVMRRLGEHLRHRVRQAVRAEVVSAVQWQVPHNLFTLQAIVTLVLIVLLYREGSLSLGTAVMINGYSWLSFKPLRLITRQLEDFQKAGAGLARIQELRRVPRGAEQPREALSLPAGALSVAFERVGFTYPGGAAPPEAASARSAVPAPGAPQSAPAVLRDVSFELQPGEVLGLLGRTGSGKSTIARLLAGFYAPQAGAIRLGGVDLRQVARQELRRRVGLVTQEVQLFRATLRENVTFFDDRVADERIWRALEVLGLAGWVRAQPQGLETMLGAGGGGLSAGESQLLALTRLLLGDPGLVILDEASSRLDPGTERLVEAALDGVLRGGVAGQGEPPAAGARTAIVIAHRLATLRRADRILILEEGRVVEYGRRDQLIHNPYSRLAALEGMQDAAGQL
jgi:ATP-binding cassette subfamily B protein